MAMSTLGGRGQRKVGAVRQVPGGHRGPGEPGGGAGAAAGSSSSHGGSRGSCCSLVGTSRSPGFSGRRPLCPGSFEGASLSSHRQDLCPIPRAVTGAAVTSEGCVGTPASPLDPAATPGDVPRDAARARPGSRPFQPSAESPPRTGGHHSATRLGQGERLHGDSLCQHSGQLGGTDPLTQFPVAAGAVTRGFRIGAQRRGWRRSFPNTGGAGRARHGPAGLRLHSWAQPAWTQASCHGAGFSGSRICRSRGSGPFAPRPRCFPPGLRVPSVRWWPAWRPWDRGLPSAPPLGAPAGDPAWRRGRRRLCP